MQIIKNNLSKWQYNELIAQLGLVLISLLVIIFDDEPLTLPFYKILIVIIYVGGATFINYVLLPYLFYKKKYLSFIIGVFATFFAILFIEEFVVLNNFCPIEKPDKGFNLLYALGQVFPVMMLFVGLKFAMDAQKKQSQLEKLKITAMKSELQFLKSQINPHFLFNNLNNLYAYALENSPKTPSIILELSSLLRYMLYDCKERYVSLDKEIKHLKGFFHLQALQIEDKGICEFNVVGEAYNKLIAPLLLIVFVENCFKHSISSQTENIKIKVTLEIENNYLKLHCVNTFSNNKNTDQLAHGIGLENVKARLNLLYADAYSLKIDATKNQYTVQLELLLNNIS